MSRAAPLRVLTVMECLGRGGTESFLVSLLPALAARGIASEVIALAGPTDVRAELEAACVPCVVVAPEARAGFAVLPRAAQLIAARLRRGDVDVAHAKLFFASLALGLAEPATRATPKIVSFHNLAYASHPADTPRLWARKRLERELVRGAADRFFALSPAVAEHYRLEQGFEPITVIPNAVPSALLRADRAALGAPTRARLGLGPDEVLFGHVARLVSEKGHDVLLDALELLERRPPHTPTSVLIAGDGPLARAIEARARAIRGPVRVALELRSIPHDEALALHAACDVALLPSRHEAFGLGAAEAMALGVPMLAGAVGGLSWLVEHRRSGWLVPPGDAAALAEAARTLADDPSLRAQLGAGARARVASRFTLDAIADQWAAAYREASGARTLNASGRRGHLPHDRA